MQKIRPFDSTEEMNETIVSKWNTIVGVKDKVYHLGDVATDKKNIDIVSRLNGDKVLIRGNHDIFKLSNYTGPKLFRDISSYHVTKDYILSHIPIHPEQLSRFKLNIHGHMHRYNLNDIRYFNVSVEQINYTPISLDMILDYKTIIGQ